MPWSPTRRGSAAGSHELVPMAALLAGPGGAGITGQAISVDGGYKV